MKTLILLFISLQLIAQDSVSNDTSQGYDLDEGRIQARQQRICTVSESDEPPFFVSSAYKQGDKTYENLRSLRDRTRQSFIPRRSIVKVPKESQHLVGTPSSYVKVEVLGINDDEFHNENLNERGKLRRATNKLTSLPKVELGEKGYLHSKSVEKVDEFTFVVTEDSPLLHFPQLQAMDVAAITPRRTGDGKFLTNRCCYSSFIFHTSVQVEYPDEPICTDEYVFQIVYADGSKGDSIGVDLNACHVANNLMPLKDQDFLAMANFIKVAKGDSALNFSTNKLELLDSRGIVKVPLDYENYDADTRSAPGPYGSLHYNLDDKGSADAYAKPMTACTFMEILKTQQEECSGYGCQIQFGNMYHPKNWGPHETHYTGKCIDIRPLRIDNTTYAMTYHNPVYDLDKTIELIKLLRRAGATNIYFNDWNVRKELPYVGRVTGHDNHIHFCLDPENEDVQKACRDGIPSIEQN
tara:strand:+ start:4595 stop:5995 length:1401 start_codon:yes stop_codon:yes gene_type:complete